MKKAYLTAVLTLTCMLGVGISARAQDTEEVRVNVPFEFVAGGTSLPAGTYTVGRVSESSQILYIRSYDNGALLLPIVFDGAATGRAKLDFEHVGERYFLSGVETLAGVYTVGLPRAMVALAQVKDQDNPSNMSPSGTK
jgi:hypothetical protein